ncbi:hypothetical protein [Streptomyces sp. NRRL S-350]|uniref:hypothetical protein n=1 Tax=Streptomyces sp. NRRL S-350 TaxID=1463902 RepID=UPI0004C0001B|nr:hypothetical protein [Streptomyces sp. NRRL S-350]
MSQHVPGTVEPTAAIALLHSRLCGMQAAEGYLNGGDTANIVDEWFTEIGMPLPDVEEHRGDEDDDEPEER